MKHRKQKKTKGKFFEDLFFIEEDEKLNRDSINNKKTKKSKTKKKLKFKLFAPIFSISLSMILYFIYNIFKHDRNINISNTKEKLNQANLEYKKESNKYFEKESYLEDIKCSTDPYLKHDFEKSEFIIISKNDCKECGFFYYYINYLGFFISGIISRRIPLIDLSSFPNVLNEFNPSDSNPWEYFFEHPYNLTLKEVKQKAKNIKIDECLENTYPIFKNIYSQKYTQNWYHDIIKKYLPIKKEIMEEVYNLMGKLFNGSTNVLGVLARGTDVITLKPKGYPIPPNIKILIEDVNKFNKENKYDFIFLATEDKKIKEKFIEEFGKKVKFLEIPNKIEYNYNGEEYFSSNKNTQGLEFQKIYFFNIIILSKCIDIISARTYGAAAAFLFSEGFRNSYVYYLGEY